MNDRGVAVFSASWTGRPHSESAAATRSIAGALTRLAPVDVFVPGTGGRVVDGAFDLTPIGVGPDGRWPDKATGAELRRTYRVSIVEDGDPGAVAAAAAMSPNTPVLTLGRAHDGDAVQLCVDLPPPGEQRDDTAATARPVGLYARIDPAARHRRHYGLRTVPDYLLVLGDRAGMPTSPWPSTRTRWVLARFPRRYVVVVEGGVARAWRSRSCVAEFAVHTRMDLWILMARASGVVDLSPGDVYARECVEALRYGIPVAVPHGSAAEGLVRRGGGKEFSSTRELLACVELLSEPSTRASLGEPGRAVADHWYGDPDRLVARLAEAVAS